MTQNPTGGGRLGKISLMTKMMKLQLAPLRSEREAAMPQNLTLMNKTVAQAVGIAKQLKDFAQYYGHEELSFTLSKVNDILHDIKLRAPKYQKTMTDFFCS